MSKNLVKPLVILLQVVLLVGCNKDEFVSVASLQKHPSVFVYMIADNDLDFYATTNINEMEELIYNNKKYDIWKK